MLSMIIIISDWNIFIVCNVHSNHVNLTYIVKHKNTKKYSESTVFIDGDIGSDDFNLDVIMWIIIGGSTLMCICITCAFLCFKSCKRKRKSTLGELKLGELQNVTSNSVTTTTRQRQTNQVDLSVMSEIQVKFDDNSMKHGHVTDGDIDIDIVGHSPGETPGDADQDRMAESLTIYSWLARNVGLPQYHQLFIYNGYDSIAFIKEIRDFSELEQIGIVNKQHQFMIMREIKKYQN